MTPTDRHRLLTLFSPLAPVRAPGLTPSTADVPHHRLNRFRLGVLYLLTSLLGNQSHLTRKLRRRAGGSTFSSPLRSRLLNLHRHISLDLSQLEVNMPSVD